MNPTPTPPTRITLPRTPEVEEAARAGFDLGLIEDNLNLTCEQRAIQHDRALALMWKLKRQYEQTGNETNASEDHLLRRLMDAQIEFVIVGDYASVAHGCDWFVTSKLEICATLTNANIQRLRKALGDLHPRHRMTSQKLSFLEVPQEGAPPLQNLYLNTDWGIIDILTNVLGVGDFERLKSTATAVPFQGKTCLVMSLEDLIQAKETLAREKDLLVAKELRAIASARKQTPRA